MKDHTDCDGTLVNGRCACGAVDFGSADITCGPDVECEHRPPCAGHENDGPSLSGHRAEDGWEARMSARAGDRAREREAVLAMAGTRVVDATGFDVVAHPVDPMAQVFLSHREVPASSAAPWWPLEGTDPAVPLRWEFEARRQPGLDGALGPETLVLDEGTTMSLAAAASAAVDRVRAGAPGFEISARVILEVRRI